VPTIVQLEGGSFALPALASGQTYQIAVTATVTAASGNVTNTASVTPPVGTTNPGTSCVSSGGITRSFSSPTCSSSDTDSVSAVFNLFISKTDSDSAYTPGETLVYTIVVTNNGPSTATNVTVTDAKPSQITTWTWTCSPAATGGATGCVGQAAGTSNFSNSGLNLPAGSSISYTVSATVASNATTTIVNTATATPSAGTNTGTSCVTSGGITRSFTAGTGACSSTDTNPLGLGIGGGHFDFDIYYFSGGKYKDAKHIHQWDNKWNVTGVNTLLPSDSNFNLSNAIPSTATQFKVLVMNQFLNPAAFLAVGTGTGQESVKTFGGLAGPSTDATTVLAGLPVYTRPAAYNPDGSSMRLIINLPRTAFNSIDWWGTGGDGVARSGAIPTQTSCVNSVNATTGATGTTGPQGERFDGALTVQIVKSTTPASALELNVAGDPRYGWRVKTGTDFVNYVLAEYTLFWHHPNGKCYGQSGWVPNPPLESESGIPDPRPSGTADPTGPIPPNPTIAP
jgi:uncharacterized repeat protein (TIGR01451 family)